MRSFPQNSIFPGAAKWLRDYEFQHLSFTKTANLLGDVLRGKLVQGGKSFGQASRNHYRFAALLGHVRRVERANFDG